MAQGFRRALRGAIGFVTPQSGELRRRWLSLWSGRPLLRAPRDPAELPLRPPPALPWAWRALIAASLAVPLLLLAIAAWQNYRLVQAEAEERVVKTVGELHEQSLKALETYELVLAWIDDRIHGLSWRQIEQSAELHRFLSNLETLPPIDAVSIIAPDGHLRATGRVFPEPDLDLADRDYFLAQKGGDGGLFIGRPHVGQLTHAPEFTVSRRRSTEDQSFDGVIAISARPRYFSDFASTVSREVGFTAALVRPDGTLIVGYPSAGPPATFPRDSRLMRAIAATPARGLFRATLTPGGVKRIYAYQRVVGFPLYVVFGIPTEGVLEAWRANLLNYSLFAVPASLALFIMTYLAGRQWQRQRLISWRWRATARRLRREMDRRAQAEAVLHQAQKMEALGQLTGGVAHDFNNLLTVLQGNLELVSGKQKDERLEARVELALKTIERGEKLTQQLLTFARRRPLHTDRIDASARLASMAELLARTVGADIAVETDFAPDLPPVAGDDNQLELAVINLAINARDAMPAGGRLRLRTFAARLSPSEGAQRAGGDFVGLEISDTGCGMPPEVLAHAFEPFFTTKEPGRGTGLGLSTVYGFARQSGGWVDISSEPGQGTTVTLYLPCAEPEKVEGILATDLPQPPQS
jgi:two-component system NtrC family sensor kinase